MVATQAAGLPPPAGTPPSMGPPSIPYVPPITLGDAVVRARVRIRLRNRRGSLALILSVILLALPVIIALAALFPSEAGATVPAFAYLYALGLTAACVFLGWSMYRVISDRTRVTYPVLAVGAALALYGAYQIVRLVELYLAWTPTDITLPADPNAYIVGMIIPGLVCAAGLVAILAGAFALPRRVHVVGA